MSESDARSVDTSTSTVQCRAQAPRESRGGRPGLPVPTELREKSEFRSCVKVEGGRPGLPVPTELREKSEFRSCVKVEGGRKPQALVYDILSFNHCRI